MPDGAVTNGVSPRRTARTELPKSQWPLGLTNKAIAEKLDNSPDTVETHVRNILERLDATNRTQIVAWVKDNEHD